MSKNHVREKGLKAVCSEGVLLFPQKAHFAWVCTLFLWGFEDLCLRITIKGLMTGNGFPGRWTISVNELPRCFLSCVSWCLEEIMGLLGNVD